MTLKDKKAPDDPSHSPIGTARARWPSAQPRASPPSDPAPDGSKLIFYERSSGYPLDKDKEAVLLTLEEWMDVEKLNRRQRPALTSPALKDRSTAARSLADLEASLQEILAAYWLTEEELVQALVSPAPTDDARR